MAYKPKLTYKGRPLVRCGNDIYYGSMSDPYIVYLQVLSNRKACTTPFPSATSCCRAFCSRRNKQKAKSKKTAAQRSFLFQ